VDATVYEIAEGPNGPYKIVLIGEKNRGRNLGSTWGPDILEWIEKNEGPIASCYAVDIAFVE
jgi:hypothetical protein